MPLLEIYKKSLAVLLAIVVLLGTSGFIIEEHQCIHCGTELSVYLIDDNGTQQTCSEDAIEECCSSEYEPKAELPKNCNNFDEPDCCTFIAESFQITDPIQASYIDFKFDDTELITSHFKTYKLKYNSNNFVIIARVFYPPGKSVIISHSQFLS